MPRTWSIHPLDHFSAKLLSKLGLGFLVLALLINLGAFLAMDYTYDGLNDTRDQIVMSSSAVEIAERIQSMLYESESGQRGYLYTNDTSYLAPLIENARLIPLRLIDLRASVKNDPEQQKSIDRVQILTRDKIAFFNMTTDYQKAGETDVVRLAVSSHRGVDLMHEIDQEILRLIVRERTTHDDLVLAWANTNAAIGWGFAAILLVNGLVIVGGAIVIIRAMAREESVIARHDIREIELSDETTRLAKELRALSAHLLHVREEERRSIARELHDELGGTLSAVKMDLVLGRDAAANRGDEKSVARLQRAASALDGAVQVVRRLIEDLRPTLLDNLGFEPALRSLAEQFSARNNVACMFNLPDLAAEAWPHLTSAQSSALYRLCQEGLTNVMKYAHATEVTITLTCKNAIWNLRLVDNGVGLDATDPNRAISHGLLGMRERMVALGGTFEVHGPTGQGTTLTATVPVTTEYEDKL